MSLTYCATLNCSIRNIKKAIKLMITLNVYNWELFNSKQDKKIQQSLTTVTIF